LIPRPHSPTPVFVNAILFRDTSMRSNLATTLIAGLMGLTAAATAAPDAAAQAYCALRDPVVQIHDVCPQATSYRSVVRTIDEAARDRIVGAVPYPMHFTELGRHTLYVGLEGSRPVGLVQSRSERSRWGLVEVVWAFDLDLNVTDFTLQRCRARAADRASVESDAFRSLLAGRSMDGMIALLSEDGKALSPEASAVIDGDADLAVSVLRCGIKTLAATEAGWHNDVTEARMWQQAFTYFPEAIGLAPLADPYASAAGEGRDGTSPVRHAEAKMYVVRSAGDLNRGVLALTGCRFGEERLDVWWVGEADPLVNASLADLRGRSLAEVDGAVECADPLKLVAAEVLVSAAFHLEGE